VPALLGAVACVCEAWELPDACCAGTSFHALQVAGTVKSGTPFLTRIGAFDVDLAVEVRTPLVYM